MVASPASRLNNRRPARTAWKSAQSATNRAINKADDHPEDKGLLAKANAAIQKSNAAGEKFNKSSDDHVANIQAHIAYYQGMTAQKESAGTTAGISVKNWFWGAAQKLGGPRRNVNEESNKTPSAPKSPKTKQPKAPKSAHTKTHHSTHPILAEACSRVLGRSKALSRKECVSGSTNSANMVKSKESKIKFEVHRFLEAAKPVSDPTVFRVVLLEEGLGRADRFQ